MSTNDAADDELVVRPPRTDTDVGAPPRTSRVVEIAAAVTAVMLTIGVVILALIMKFEADQARWEQRQACLSWYRLQAEYGLGPWYDQLPRAAADCGGDTDPSGTQLVPGGSKPALDPQSRPSAPGTSVRPTTTPPSTAARGAPGAESIVTTTTTTTSTASTTTTQVLRR